MYCPRCGHQPISDSLRFCSYCGFKLGVVKASLEDEPVALEQAPPQTPRHRDMNIGVILMFGGAMLAALMAGRGFGLGREAGALALTVFFFATVLLSKHIMKLVYRLLSWEEPTADSASVNQRSMIFGSMLMFAGTLFVAIASLFMFGRMRTFEFFSVLFAAFVFLLFLSKYLMRAVRYLVSADAEMVARTSAIRDPVAMDDAALTPALSPAAGMPVSVLISQRVTTAEIVPPSSVTEHTTNLLENK